VPKLWTSETAAIAGRKGRASQLARAAARKSDPVTIVREALPDLFADLLKAARGEAPFHDLPPDKRLAALTKALEYGAGRPIAVDKGGAAHSAGEGGGSEAADGLSIE